jgi:hypothetical protein
MLRKFILLCLSLTITQAQFCMLTKAAVESITNEFKSAVTITNDLSKVRDCIEKLKHNGHKLGESFLATALNSQSILKIIDYLVKQEAPISAESLVNATKFLLKARNSKTTCFKQEKSKKHVSDFKELREYKQRVHEWETIHKLLFDNAPEAILEAAKQRIGAVVASKTYKQIP